MADPAPTPTPTNLTPAPPADPTPTPAPEPVGGTLLGEPPAAPVAPVDPAAVPPAAPVVGVTAADLTLPEGITADNPALQQFLKEAGEAKLPKETSQKLLDQHYSALKEAGEAPLKVFKEMNEKWVAEIKADPEIGGAKLDGEVKPAVAKLIDQFGGDKLRFALDLTGAGNNPDIVRAFYQMAKALTENTNAVRGNPQVAPARPAPAAALYPNLVKQDNS